MTAAHWDEGRGNERRILFFKAKATEHHAHTTHICHFCLQHALQLSLWANLAQKTIAGPQHEMMVSPQCLLN